MAGPGVAADGAGIGDGDGEAEHPGGHPGAGVVVVAEVSGDLVDSEPDGRDGGVQGVGEGLAGQHRPAGQLPGFIGEVRAGLGDEQHAVVVFDDGFHAQGGDGFGVASGDQVVEQPGGDGGCHDGSAGGLGRDGAVRMRPAVSARPGMPRCTVAARRAR